MKLTHEQKSSLSFDRHIGLTANAGSGKTTVLQKRYLSILEHGLADPNPSRIVAITFTKKAAAEILAKISKGVDEKIQNGTIKERMRFADIRDRLGNAQISTIHSFCAQILRDFPIESGTNPNFAELPEQEKIKLSKEAIEVVMERWLVENPESREKLTKWVAAEGMFLIRNYLEEILKNKEKYLRHKQVLLKTNDELTEELRRKVFQLIAHDLINIFRYFRLILLDVYGDQEKKVRPTLDSIGKFIDDFEDFFYDGYYKKYEGVMEDVLIRINAVIAEMVKTIFTTKYLLRQAIEKQIDDQTKAIYNKLAEPLERVKEYSELFQEQDISTKVFDFNREFMELADEVIEEIDSKKEFLGVVEFSDMILKAHAILQDEDVASRVREKYDFLMVDEFQDTDQMQYDIIKRLVPAIEGIDVEHKINLFLVGDAKQSIYGFRSADVRVIGSAVEDIKLANARAESRGHLAEKINTVDGEIEPIDDNAMYGDMRLSASFRLLPNIAAFVNLVCGNIMKKRNEFEVDYSELVCGRNVAELRESLRYSLECGPDFGAIDYILEITEKESDSNESKRIVNYIKDCTNGRFGNYSYSEIAVLSRRNKTFGSLIDELQKEGIAYQVGSGTDFWSTPEIMDMKSLFKFLENPGDDIAFASLLKSPMFKISDTMLFKIAKSQKKGSLWEKFCEFTDEEIDDFLLKRSREIVGEIRKSRDRLSIADFIRFVLDRTSWYMTIANDEGADQKEANIEKFIGMAREFVSKGFRDYYDFVRELELIEEHEIIEKEEINESKSNSVNLMSMHKAKGLEFPVVIIIDMNSGSGRNESLHFTDDFGYAKKVPNEKDPLKPDLESLVYKYSKEVKALAEAAEDKRLLYVAMTRAKNRLCLSATLNEKNYNNGITKNYLNLLLEGMKVSVDTLHQDESIGCMSELKLVEEGEVTDSLISFNVNKYKEQVDVQSHIDQSSSIKADYKLSNNEIETKIVNGQYSASKLHSFERGGLEYELKYILGLPDLDDESDDVVQAGQSGEEIKGSHAGTLIHGVLERIKEWMNSAGEINEMILNDCIESLSKETERPLSETIKNRIKTECTAISRTKLVRGLTENVLSGEHEYSMNLPVEDFFMNGIIDVLITNENGELEVWDWKTNVVDSEIDFARHLENYELQMKIYAFFVLLMQPKQKEIKCRLLFTRLAGDNAEDDDWTHVYKWDRQEVNEFADEIKSLVARTHINI